MTACIPALGRPLATDGVQPDLYTPLTAPAGNAPGSADSGWKQWCRKTWREELAEFYTQSGNRCCTLLCRPHTLQDRGPFGLLRSSQLHRVSCIPDRFPKPTPHPTHVCSVGMYIHIHIRTYVVCYFDHLVGGGFIRLSWSWVRRIMAQSSQGRG